MTEAVDILPAEKENDLVAAVEIPKVIVKPPRIDVFRESERLREHW